MYNTSPSLHQQLTSLNNRSLYILYITSPTHGSTISAFAHIVSLFSPLSPHSSILKVAHSLLIYSNYSVMHLMVELHGCSSSHFTLNASLSNVDAGWGDKHGLWKPVNISKDEEEKKSLKLIFCLLPEREKKRKSLSFLYISDLLCFCQCNRKQTCLLYDPLHVDVSSKHIYYSTKITLQVILPGVFHFIKIQWKCQDEFSNILMIVIKSIDI